MEHKIEIVYRDEGESQYRRIIVDGEEGGKFPPRLKKWLLQDWLDEIMR